MHIGVLGAVRAVVDDRPVALGGPKQRLVLAHLVLRANEVVPTDRLLDAVWNGQPGSRSSLHTYVSHLRKALGPDRIETQGQGTAYRLRAEADEVDALRFTELTARGHALLEVDPPAAHAALTEALALWQGPPFADLDGEPSLRAAVERLEELRLAAIEDRLVAQLALGESARLAPELEALTAEHPWRERLWELRILALYRAGRQADALAVYTRARDMLLEELGVDPSPGLQDLHGRILRHDPALLPAAAHPDGTGGVALLARTTNPYKGLLPFTEDDAEVFFGREDLVARLAGRLADGCRLLAVVGPSGSGKSSLVRAGLVPALAAGAVEGSERWRVAVLTPGADPVAALVRGLGQLDGDGLLVVDQLEELYTAATATAERGRFAAELAEAATRPTGIRVVVTLRADFYDRPLADPQLADLVRDGTEVVLPLSPAGLQQAITGPATKVGVHVHPDLVAHMVGDVTDQPGALPLLQYALTEVFDRRLDGVLDLATYELVGGVSGALARRAEDLHASLSEAGRRTTRELFLRLVTPGEGTEDTRRRVPRDELVSALPGAADLVEVYGAARLLSLDHDPLSGAATVEVAHEALLRAWQRLRGWVDGARDDLRTHRRLAAAAAEWAASGQDDSYLATGTRVQELEAWRAGTGVTLTAAEGQFLDASVRARERREAAEAERSARERALEQRSHRRLRALVAVLAVAALLGGAISAYAVAQGRRAAEEALTARARELAAAADANLQTDPERSILLALEAIATTRAVDGRVLPEAEAALHRAVSASRAVLSVAGVGGAIAWSPTGDVLLTEGPENTGLVELRSADTGEPVRSWPGHEIDVNDVAVSGDGALVASTGDDGALRVWDSESGELRVEHVATAQQEVWGPSFSPDGALAAAWFKDDGVVRVVDTATGEVTATVPSAHSKRTAFSPDGTQLAHSTEESVQVVDLATLDVVHDLPHASVHRMAWSPDGRWLASGNADGVPTARVWDARTGQPWDTLHGHSGFVFDVAWSPDSGRLATAGHDGTARVWEIGEDGAVETLRLRSEGLRNAVYGVAFSPDGTRLLTSNLSVDGMTIFDVEPGADGEWAVIPAEPNAPMAFAADGTLVAASRPGEVVGWDPRNGRERWSFAHGLDQVWGLETHVEAGVGVLRDDREVLWWDLATRRRIHRQGLPADTAGLAVGAEGHAAVSIWEPGADLTVYDRQGAVRWSQAADAGATYWNVAIDAAGRRLAGQQYHHDGSDRGRLRIWDVERAERLADIEVHGFDLDIDDAGKQVALGGLDGATIYDAETGSVAQRLPDHNALSVAFSPDGLLLATGDFDGTVRVLEIATGNERMSVTAHGDGVRGVAFSPDGRQLASTSADGSIRVWAVDLEDLIELARGKLSRDLTDAECRRFLRTEACPG
jgi:WD40 repeat protein/DNA-binding SARP family transcriptional activator